MPQEPLTGTFPASHDEVRARLLASGWRQGSVLPDDLAMLVHPVLGGFSPPGDGVWPTKRMYIVVSQDCDICSSDFANEPTIEVVLAKKVKQLHGRFEHLRSPRALHLNLTCNGGVLQPVEVSSRNRGYLDHRLLLEYQPSAEFSVDGPAVEEVAALLSRRYLRSTRPDAFDARWQPVKSALEEFLDREVGAGAVLDVLLRIEPLEELSDNESYALTATVVLTDVYDDLPKSDTRDHIDEVRAQLTSILGSCSGIELEGVEVLGRAQVSLRDVQDLRSFEIVWPRFAREAAQGQDGDEE